MSRNLIAATLVAGAITLGACADPEVPSAPTASPQPAGIQGSAQSADADYIVVFRGDVRDVPGLARRLVAERGGQLRHTYTSAIQGFAARLPAAAIEGLRHNPNIALIEADQVMSIVATTQTGAT